MVEAVWGRLVPISRRHQRDPGDGFAGCFASSRCCAGLRRSRHVFCWAGASRPRSAPPICSPVCCRAGPRT